MGNFCRVLRRDSLESRSLEIVLLVNLHTEFEQIRDDDDILGLSSAL